MKASSVAHLPVPAQRLATFVNEQSKDEEEADGSYPELQAAKEKGSKTTQPPPAGAAPAPALTVVLSSMVHHVLGAWRVGGAGSGPEYRITVKSSQVICSHPPRRGPRDKTRTERNARSRLTVTSRPLGVGVRSRPGAAGPSRRCSGEL